MVNESIEAAEISRVPSIVINNIIASDTTIIAEEDYVINKSDHTAVKILGPRRSNIDFELSIATGTTRDQNRLVDEIHKFFDSHPTIKSWGLDEDFRLILMNDFDKLTSSLWDDLHSGKFRCMMAHALFFERDAQDAYAVMKLSITGGNVDVDVQ
jgi:hypothetical protein